MLKLSSFTRSNRDRHSYRDHAYGTALESIDAGRDSHIGDAIGPEIALDSM
jgi:hypothetical protein